MPGLPRPMNTSKGQKYMHGEQLLLKTTWKLAERLFYNQSCKKDLHKRKGREAIRSGPTTLGRDTEEERDMMNSEILPKK